MRVLRRANHRAVLINKATDRALTFFGNSFTLLIDAWTERVI